MKILVSDYDGTFYHTEEQTLRNIEAVKQWKAAGNIFVFATGRDVCNMGYEFDRFGVTYDYLVGVNGAYVSDDKGNVLYKEVLNNNTARTIVDLIKEDCKGQLLVQNGIDGCYVINESNDPHTEQIREKCLKLYKKTADEALNDEVVSVGARFYDLNVAKKYNDYINEHFKDVTSFNNITYINVVPNGLSKATGIKLIAEKINVNIKDVYTIGDNLNDFEMIKEFDGACVSNAVEDILKITNKVYDSVEEYIKENL